MRAASAVPRPFTKLRPLAKLWPADTLGRRFAVTTVLAIVVAVTLSALFAQFAGVWARPPLRELDLLERADDVVRMLDAIPAPQRPAAAAAASRTYTVGWFPAASAAGAWLDAALRLPTAHRPDSYQFLLNGQERRVATFGLTGLQPDLAALIADPARHPSAQFLAVGLGDGSWVVLTVPERFWGWLNRPVRIGIGLTFLVLSIAAVSCVATRRMSRPIRDFTEALHRFGANPRAAPMVVTGPRELRRAMGAFNGMQAKIQRFVDERTTMLAAISHDLRTPLTRIRLRSELVEDAAQRARLFHDVDEMQAMVGAALSFFSDDGAAEAGTAFDFPGLLHTIVDEQNDHAGDPGGPVAYAGPDRAAFFGRPLALKRAFTNLVDNAVKYGGGCEVELQCGPEGAAVLVRDRGPGIPEAAAEQVFTPFFRLEGSRNRATGGIGLGLTSARAVILDHGGQITLRNRETGGLEVQVSLPRAA